MKFIVLFALLLLGATPKPSPQPTPGIGGSGIGGFCLIASCYVNIEPHSELQFSPVSLAKICAAPDPSAPPGSQVEARMSDGREVLITCDSTTMGELLITIRILPKTSP